MAEQRLQADEGLHIPRAATFIVATGCFGSSYAALQWILCSKGLLPAYIPKSVPLLTLRCLAFACLPLVLQVLTATLFRILVQPLPDSKLSQVSSNVVRNTLESTLLFGLNFLAFSTCKIASPERLILLALFFVAARLIFWLGYYVFYYTDNSLWRGPGMSMTIGTYIFMFYYSMMGLYDE